MVCAAEKSAVEAKAARAGIPVSQYVRELILGAAAVAVN
jgi:hypothetical protein